MALDEELLTESRQRVDELLAHKAENGGNIAAAGKSLLRKIDGLYWKRVEAILRQKATADRETLDFTPDERLWIDLGLVDERLVDGADEALRGQLLTELQTTGMLNHFYLSEWLEDRYRKYRLQQEVAAADNAASAAGDRLSKARKGILGRIGSLFDGLAGVSKEVSALVVSGGLDDVLLKAGLSALQPRSRKALLYRNRLRGLRKQVIRKARARSDAPAILKLFDALDGVYKQDWRERYQAHAKGQLAASPQDAQKAAETAAASRLEETATYLVSELKFAKSLLPLGALAGGVSRSFAVMTEAGARVNKKETAAGIRLARDCDRAFDLDPVVLIAPFRGRGIYEWDRDSLVISLYPVEGAADSMANAVGNYRMLIDSLQQSGALRTAYESNFPDTRFQAAFQEDYRAWICGVGQGRADALAADHFDFFLHHIGPDCSGPLVPLELRHLSASALRLVRKRLYKQLETAPDDPQPHVRLAAIAWLMDDAETSLNHMALAVKQAPTHGRILFGLALLLRTTGDTDKAKAVMAMTCKRAAKTVWGVYAQQALTGRI